MKKTLFALSFFLLTAAFALQAGPEQLCGMWESVDGKVMISLLREEGSSLQIRNEGTLFIFPLTWRASPKFIEITYSADPQIQTKDPYYELVGPPKKPRRPVKMAYKLAKDGKSLTLDNRVFVPST